MQIQRHHLYSKVCAVHKLVLRRQNYLPQRRVPAPKEPIGTPVLQVVQNELKPKPVTPKRMRNPVRPRRHPPPQGEQVRQLVK